MSGVDELLAFVRRCLDDDERVALEAGSPGRWAREALSCVVDATDSGLIVYGEGTPTPEQAEHIARWDPKRVLDEVEAKRQRLDWIEGELVDDVDNQTAQWLAKLEAQPFAGYDGWREEWLVSGGS